MLRNIQVLVAFALFMSALLFDEGLSRVPILGRWVSREDDPARAAPRALVAQLQKLGGSFIKFGQLMSMRADILPMRYCKALAGLFDKVPPFAIDEAKAIIESELGQPVEQLFEAFDDIPLGAASFGQVHRVILGQGPDKGTEAVIKIQRPGLEDQINKDARMLVLVGRLMDSTGLLGQIKLTPVFEDFVRWTRRETNFTQEAKNADRLFEETEWNFNQRIPYIYWDYTSPKVMTMEFLKGLSASELLQRFEANDPDIDAELEAMNCDRQTIARNIYQNFYLQAFIGKVFHADPHPGNLIVLPNNVIGYVDFGLLGRMGPESLQEQQAVVEALASTNMERLFTAILDVLDAPRGLLVTDHFHTFSEVADAWLDACDNPGATLSEKSVNNFVSGIMGLARNIGLPLSMNTTLYYKALMSVDASILRIDPSLDYNIETTRALRMVKLRHVEHYLAPGQALDRSLNLSLLLLKMPDLLAEQVVNLQQGTRRMYRKFNQFPIVAAQLVQAAGRFCLLLGAVLASIDLGYAHHYIPDVILNHPDFQAIVTETLAPHAWIMVVLWLALGWVARTIRGQSLVKVQQNG
ncbi:MAG: AarF/UbiB family protein [Myxococcota bacterium]